VKEQFVEVLPEEVRVWVKEKKPRTTQEAGRLARGLPPGQEGRAVGTSTKYWYQEGNASSEGILFLRTAGTAGRGL